jgi:hypothetical protein
MDKTFNKDSFKRLTRIIRIVVQSFYWASIVCGALCLIGFIVLQFIPGEYLMSNDNAGFTLSLDGMIRYEAGDKAVNLAGVYQSITIMAALLSAGLAVFLKHLAALLKTVEGDTPFTTGNTNRLKTMGIILLLYAFLAPGAGVLVASSMVHAFAANNITVVYSVNISLLFSGFVLLILAGIFQYGSFLQSEYDTTL